MIRPLLGLAAAGYMFWRWKQGKPLTSAVKPQRAVRHAVNTWEGEGGALPEQPAVPGQREFRPETTM